MDTPTLHDAAARLVALEPTDREGLIALGAQLQSIASGADWPPAVQELVGRAVWRLMDAADGDGAGFMEAGECLDRALELLEMGETAVEEMPEEEDLPDHVEIAPVQAPSAGLIELVPPDTDAELLQDFLTEAAEYIAAAEAALLELEADPLDAEAINTVFRAFHTIKGTSGFVRTGLITEVAHRAESVLMRMRSGEIQCAGPYADLVFRAIDTLKSLVRSIEGKGPGALGALPEGYGELLSTLTRVGGPGGFAPTFAEHTRSPIKQQHVDLLAESSIRVRIDRLDRLIDMVGELVIAHSMVAQDRHVAVSVDQLQDGEAELARKVIHAGKIVRDLQDLSLSLRMVPLRSTFQRLTRAVRDVARQCDKAVDLVTEGEDTEIDRNMVDVIADPLLHMIRNGVDHGIETPDERERAGKPRAGTLWLRAYHAGGNVVVELRDDGRGLNRARIAAKGIERGLIATDAGMSDAEVFALIFEAGFSTADQITDISGRGVGMDVVRAAVEALRGRIELSSEPGRGTTFTMRLPLTLAITDGMTVRIGAERYVMPTANIHLTLRPTPDRLSTVAGRGELVRLRDELLPVFRLARLFEIDGAVEDPTGGLLVVVDDGDGKCAVLVDELLGQQQVVAKSLGEYVGAVDGVSGGAILGDGRVGLILDPFDIGALARRGTRRADAGNERNNGMGETAKAVVSEPRTGGGKFLTFFLADEEYGLEILKVQEIIGLLPITRVPRTPPFVKGVVNLRGKVIPVTDLRVKFGMEAAEATAETCVVIVRANGVEVGLVVDRVSEVLDIAAEQIEAPPAFGPEVDTRYLLGIAKHDGGVKLLLDIEHVLTTQDVLDIRATATAGAAA